MPERERVEMRDFLGLMLETDPYDLRPGALQDQVNIGNQEEGSLTVRRGTRLVTFETE